MRCANLLEFVQATNSSSVCSRNVIALTQVAFHGFCPLFVLTSALMMASCAVLGILGTVWSCTRGCAALVVLSLGLLGDLMLFGGFVSCLLWFVLSAAVIYLYFVFLPSQYAEKEGEQGKGGGAPWWLQDLGSFHVSTDLDTVHLLLYLSVSVSVCICQVCTHLHTTNICLARGLGWTVCQVAPLDVCQVSPPVRVSVLESVVEGKRIGGKDLGVFVSSLSRPSVSLS